jgi:hypothetical protein
MFEVAGDRGFVRVVFKNKGFLDSVGIGDREITSRELIFIMD